MKLSSIALVALLGLQNPSPSGGEFSQPAKEVSEIEQHYPASANAITNVTPAVVNLGSHPSEQRRDNATDPNGDKTPQDGCFSPIWVAVYVSVFASCVGIAQFIMYWRQWCMMRKALIQTERISRRTLKHSRESSEKGLRAYVSVKSHNISEKDAKESTDALPEAYMLFIENTGITPAYSVQFHSSWDYFQGDSVDWPQEVPLKTNIQIIALDARRGSKSILGTGQSNRYRCDFKPHQDGTKFADAIVRASQRQVTVFIFGVITYRDVFKTERFAQFSIKTVCQKVGITSFCGAEVYHESD